MDNVNFEAVIKSFDDERQIVFGWASVAIDKSGAEVFDREGDAISLQALEDAAYEFNLNFRKTGVEHRGPAVGTLVESFVVTPQKLEMLGLEKNALPHGWLVGFKIEDDAIWKNVKDNKYSGFSVQGKGMKEVC